MKAAPIIFALFALSSSASAQEFMGRGQLADNDRFVSDHSLAYIPKAGFAVQLLDVRCPSTGSGESGNVALVEREGFIANYGCYKIKSSGDVDVAWYDGTKRYYRRESIRLTLLGKRIMDGNDDK